MRPALVLLLSCVAALALPAFGDDEDQGGGGDGGQAPESVPEAPAEEAPATEAPAEEAPATEAPAEEAPATEAPAEEAPATEAPAEEAPATEAPAEEAPATEAPAEEAPATEAPAEEGPVTEAPAEGPATEAPPTETPPEEVPATEAPPTEAPAEEGPATEGPAEATTAEPPVVIATTATIPTTTLHSSVEASRASTQSLLSTVLSATATTPRNGSLAGPGVNSTYRPPTTTQIPDCFSCLISQHYRLELVNNSCELVGDFAGCLAKCRLALRPESSLVAAIDFYTAFKQQACQLSGCSENVTSCFDSFAIYHEGFLSMSLRCGNGDALAESLRCLAEEANSSPQCVLNPGIVTYFLRAGADYLCNKDLRCFDYGNVFEPLPNGSFVQYSSVTTARFTKSCPLRTGFKTEECGCILVPQTGPTIQPTTAIGTTMALKNSTARASSTAAGSASTITYRPAITAPPSDCSKCLSGYHETLRSVDDPCSLVNDVSYCLSTCRPSAQPHSSLVSLADFYNTFRTANCPLPGCSPTASACFDSFAVWRSGLESMTFRCGDTSAFGQTTDCLSQVANESPNCAVNPNDLASFFLNAGSSYLCDQRQRCFDYGNVYEPVSSNKTVYVQYSAINGQRFQRSCPRGTVFSISDCVCIRS